MSLIIVHYLNPAWAVPWWSLCYEHSGTPPGMLCHTA